MKLGIQLKFDKNLTSMDAKFQEALKEKFVYAVNLMQDRLVENVTGRILNKRTGALLAKIEASKELKITSKQLYAFVGVKDAGKKEKTLEFGGRKAYAIFPVRARALRWIDEAGVKQFRAYVLHHPPLKAFGYLRDVEEEIGPILMYELEDMLKKPIAFWYL